MSSIVAQGFLATNLKNFNVIAVAQDVTPIGGSDAKDTALLKIYIDGYLKGAAAVDFTAIISLADIQFQIHQILSTYVIQRPILSIRAANYPGPGVRPSGAGILGSSLIGPFEGATVSLVDADDLEDGDSALDDALSDANSTIAAMAAMGENAVNAQTLYYAIRTGINPIQGIQVRGPMVSTFSPFQLRCVLLPPVHTPSPAGVGKLARSISILTHPVRHECSKRPNAHRNCSMAWTAWDTTR